VPPKVEKGIIEGKLWLMKNMLKVLQKRDFLKKGGKVSLSLGVGITLLCRKPLALDRG
jgi:hypothetical protein